MLFFHNFIYELKQKLIFIAIFTLILFLVWSLITFYYKELDDLHSLITKYCFIVLLVIHIEDFTSQRLTMYRFAGLNPLTYLASTFAYHYIFFIYAFLLEFIFLLATPLDILAQKKVYTTHLDEIAIRVLFAGFSIIPLFYLLGFILKRLNDPYTLVAFIQYIVSSSMVFITIHLDFEKTFIPILLESFPMNYFKMTFINDKTFDHFLYWTTGLQVIYGVLIFLLVWFLHRRYSMRHRIKKTKKGTESKKQEKQMLLGA